jgi:hypothetical protein
MTLLGPFWGYLSHSDILGNKKVHMATQRENLGGSTDVDHATVSGVCNKQHSTVMLLPVSTCLVWVTNCSNQCSRKIPTLSVRKARRRIRHTFLDLTVPNKQNYSYKLHKFTDKIITGQKGTTQQCQVFPEEKVVQISTSPEHSIQKSLRCLIQREQGLKFQLSYYQK